MVKTDGSTCRAIEAQSGWASIVPCSEWTWVRKPSIERSCARMVLISTPTPAALTATTSSRPNPAMIDDARGTRSRFIPRATGRLRTSVRIPASVARLPAIDAMSRLDEPRPECCLSLGEAQHGRVQLLEAFLDLGVVIGVHAGDQLLGGRDACAERVTDLAVRTRERGRDGAARTGRLKSLHVRECVLHGGSARDVRAAGNDILVVGRDLSAVLHVHVHVRGSGLAGRELLVGVRKRRLCRGQLVPGRIALPGCGVQEVTERA